MPQNRLNGFIVYTDRVKICREAAAECVRFLCSPSGRAVSGSVIVLAPSASEVEMPRD